MQTEDFEVRIIFDDKKGSYADKRKDAWSAKRTRKTTFYVSTYAAFRLDESIVRQSILMPSWTINDEAKRLRNIKSQAYEAERPFAALAKLGTLFLEGTPTKRGPIDFWTMLNLIDPKLFKSYWQFMNHFYEKGVVANGAEPFDVDTLQNLHHWEEILQRFARVRFRKDVRQDMPRVQRQIVPVRMDNVQEAWYRTLDEVRYAFTASGELIIAQTTLDGLTRMRQILTCPKILDPKSESYGNAIVGVADQIDEDAAQGGSHHVLYSAFKEAIPHFAEYLHSRGHRNIFRMHGSMHPEEAYRQRKAFSRDGGIMLCTVQYAEAFSLEPATHCHFIGCAYDPNTNKQAEDRLLPQLGSNPIYSGYWTYEGTHDQRVIEMLNGYQAMIDKTLIPTRDT